MTFAVLSQYFQKLEATPSRNTMTVILAELFKKAPPGEIDKLCYLLQGRVAPLYEAIEFGIADKFIIRAIALAYNVDKHSVLKEFKKTGDLGIVAEHLHKGKDQQYSVNDVFTSLEEITQTNGAGSQEKKIASIADLLKHVDSLSARYIVRIPLDKLRLGFSDMTILDSLSWMLTGDKSLRVKLEGAYNVRPDIGFIAQTVKARGIQGLGKISAKIGVPVLAALCQRLPNAEEMIEKMGEVAVEPKYDGVRVQIHFEKGKVQTFSRNLENTTAMFPELSKIGRQLNAKEVILDCEAIGIDPKTGKLISFQETMTRKRKHDIASMLINVPLRFFVFDVLYVDGRDLLSLPFSKRREILERLVKNNSLIPLSPQIVTTDAAEIRRYHDKQIAKGLEGVVVKKWNGVYEPGRRGFSWVKFKEEEGKTGKLTDTIDAVVMGYYRGEGKRAGFGIGAFLVGVRKGEEFVTVTKIGTGVSDKLWKDLKVQLNKLKSAKKPKEYGEVNKIFIPDVWTEPKLVVELAGDDLTKSPTHGAHVAVRFPRLVRIRTDKSFKDVTTVKEVEQMYRQQGQKT